MKRASPGLLESRRPRSPPRVSVFLDQLYLSLNVFAGKSLRNILSGQMEAGLGVCLAHYDFARVSRGLLWQCGQHWQALLGPWGISYKDAGPARGEK